MASMLRAAEEVCRQASGVRSPLVRVLTWNLFHGRTVPNSGRSRFNDFAAMLGGWAWDLALLQETPPWWPEPLARACGADRRLVLTSRNRLLPLRRAISDRNPDLLKANGGGCNAILVRGQSVLDHRTLRLARWPEGRWAHGVRLDGGAWAVNLHATTNAPKRATKECRHAAVVAHDWAGRTPLVFGGDLNLKGRPELPSLEHVAGNHVDHLLVSGFTPAGRAQVLDRGALSDHPPVAIDLA
jgi:endonuclease/exonuclease/phosphatase family metal-dependent hydrolase